MTTYSSSFSTTGSSSELHVVAGDSLDYEVDGRGTVLLEFTRTNGATWETKATITDSGSDTVLADVNGRWRLTCTAFTSRLLYTLGDASTTSQEFKDLNGTTQMSISEDGVFANLNLPTGMICYDAGSYDTNLLRVASDVVSATKVTIGADVYEIEIVNTDTTDNTSALASFANTTDPLTLAAFTTTYTNTTIAVGGLLRLENEIVRCIKSSGASRTFQRGACGTTTASHANTSVDIYKGDGLAGGSTVAVGLVTTLTPTAFTAALVADINAMGTEKVTATLVGVNEILLVHDLVGAYGIATTENLAGANNLWSAATMYGGRARSVRYLSICQRVPTATEDAFDEMYFKFGFTPTLVQVFVTVTATPGLAVAWDGGITINPTVGGAEQVGVVLLDNGGTTDWSASHNVTVLATA